MAIIKPGVFLNYVFSRMSFEEALDFAKSNGLEAIELATGNYAGVGPVDPLELWSNEGKRKALLHAVESRGLIISSCSAHGNPLHPNKSYARLHHETFMRTIDLAYMLGVGVVTGFSGCPGDQDNAKYPNFPINAFLEDSIELFNWQWEAKVIPYWREVGRYAAARGIKIAIEPFVGMSVYSPYTLLKLRYAVGEVIGVNLDPSQLFWQGIDPVEAVKILGYHGAIFHCSGKDTQLFPNNINMYSVLDMQPFNKLDTRSWIFRTIGYGHDAKMWADFVTALKLSGYNHVISIEHEDELIEGLEGVSKAAKLLREVIVR
ncbi:MAG TPA: sugar phosphate isomerase/epimerase [Candidatus Udaeobacter sp.]|nr:sugar phosphate isomerase/epimerase [Candidatus Udaeobacter sp.]